MVKFTWYKNMVPSDLKVRQVYGFAFMDDGRTILRIENSKYQLTGGKPENNEMFEETLIREYIEEINVELQDIHYLGYLLVEEDNKKYAQVRMVARIKNINENHIDPATGKMYGRKLVSIDKIKECLNYSGDAGNKMIDDAINMAKEKYKFKRINNEEEDIN